MVISLGTRTTETVRKYFFKAQASEIKSVLPQEAQSVQEALDEYEKSLRPGASSYGRTILVGGAYIGDVWCYCIDPDGDPNAMLSYCIIEDSYRNKGIATAAVRMFLEDACARFGLKTVGAFTYSDNTASIRVLEKNGFRLEEEFLEDGRASKFFLYDRS